MSLIGIDNILVDDGSEEMRRMGFKSFELRSHGALLRVALGSRDLEKALTPEIANELAQRMKALGYKYVALDLEPLENSWTGS
jgi:pyridinium-3,5-biscarboxylic acid mononucleotide sulfurtransferase